MNTPTSDIEQLSITMDNAKQMILRGKAMARLLENPDFVALFDRGYLHDEAVRLVHAKGNPALQDDDPQRGMDHDIRAISSFGNYCDRITRTAELAIQALADSAREMERAEAEQEEREAEEVSGMNAANVHPL